MECSSSESTAEKRSRLGGEGIALAYRVAQAIRTGAPEAGILDDVARLYILIEDVEALRTAEEPKPAGGE